jgi:16S rRNA G527 N7-methylase RsmG
MNELLKKSELNNFEKIKEYAINYNIELEQNEIKKFEQFLDIFMKKNSQINLSAIRDKE